MVRAASSLPPVRDVLRLALPFGSRVLAGTLGLERPVRRARVGGVLSPIFPELDREELALLDLPRVQASNPGLTGARVVRELNRLGIAALGVVGSVDLPALREAERANLPLLQLPDGSDLAQAGRAIQRLIDDPEAQGAVQGAALYRDLVEGLMAGQGAAWMVARLHELTSHTVHLADSQGAPIAEAGEARHDGSALARHGHPLQAGEQTVGQLTFGGPEEEFDMFSQIALEQGAAALALEVVKQEAVQAARSGVARGLAAAVLGGADEATLRSLARVEGYPLDTLHWAVLVSIPADQADARLEAVPLWAQRIADRAVDLGWSVAHHVEPSGGTWNVLWVLAGDQPWGPPHQALLQLLRQTWHEAGTLSIAAGDPAPTVEGLQVSVAQARDALSLGERLFGAGQTYLHRDMGVYRVLRHVQGTGDLAAFVESTLGAVRTYDATHGSDLLATVETVLTHGGNISAAAKALHLHRNSLTYRVERIRALSGLDPTTPEDAFTFRLALLLAPLM